jgi:iron complex outermembrane receptor protein
LQGGYIDNLEYDDDDVNDHVQSGVRLALQWQPNDRFTAVARVLLQRQAYGGADMHELDDPHQSQTRVLNEAAIATRFLANVDIAYEFDTATLHSTTSWNDDQGKFRLDVTDWMFNVLGIPVPARSETMRDTKDLTQEVRIESRDRERFDWLAGVFYQHRDNVYSQNFPAPGFDELFGGAAADFGYPDNLYATNVPTPGEELAAYGELGWRPDGYWRFAAGARWFRMDRREHEQADGFLNGGPTDRLEEATETGVSPRATLSYAPSPERTYYAVASKGFRSGGPNLPVGGEWGFCDADLAALGYDSLPVSYSSDELWNYEIGARQTLQEGRLSLAGTVYRIDWSRIQTLVYLQCGWGFIQNAGDARNEGIEFELSYRATAGLDLRLAASYVDARLLQPAPGSISNPGDALPGVPDLTGGLSATWQFYSGKTFSASLYGLWSYVGERSTGSLTSSRQRLDAYDLLNLRLQLAGQRWSAALSVDNVFDEDGVLYLWNDSAFRAEYTTRPRTLRLTVRYAL